MNLASALPLVPSKCVIVDTILKLAVFVPETGSPDALGA